VTLALLDAMVERWGIRVGETALRNGLAAARWPGRLELLDGTAVGHRRVLLDGAHNPAGARALARALADLGLRRPTIVFGAMRGKDVRGVLSELAPLDPQLVFTRVRDPNAHDPAQLAETWRRLGRSAQVAADPRRAIEIARGDPVVVAGSLYLVGEVRGMITGTREEA
jgi:dihydrofolate synthase/folylpolyglutamate synthase